MPNLKEITIPVNFELTETSKAVLTNLILDILKEKEVVNLLSHLIQESKITKIDLSKPN